MEFILQNSAFVAIGVVLFLLAARLCSRYYSSVTTKSQQTLLPTTIKCPPQISSTQDQSFVASPEKNIAEKLTNDDSILEEAELYSNHGRPASAVKILLEVVNRHPSNQVAWSLLLSNYSSLGKVAEFEKVAREFLMHHKASPLWNGIQALGRTLDHKNALYGSQSSASLLPNAANSRRPVGNILIEIGALTYQDLHSWLDDFDPMLHGRFGGYLLSHKVISLAQLDQALMLQQC